MDFSTSWHDDPKWKVIWRRRPDLVAVCAYVYTVLAAESWRTGSRITVHDAWPPLVAYDADAVAELMHAKLIDRAGKVLIKTWDGWYGPALERQRMSRERWQRANEKRHQQALRRIDGDNDDTAA